MTVGYGFSYAAGEGHEAVVKLLVEPDDVEADSKDRSRSLPWAVEEGHIAVVLLLERTVSNDRVG